MKLKELFNDSLWERLLWRPLAAEAGLYCSCMAER
jgi:hypothetical protein